MTRPRRFQKWPLIKHRGKHRKVEVRTVTNDGTVVEHYWRAYYPGDYPKGLEYFRQFGRLTITRTLR